MRFPDYTTTPGIDSRKPDVDFTGCNPKRGPQPGVFAARLTAVILASPPPPLQALVGRPHGADSGAAGGLPKRRKWTVCGGHGRNGAG